eukprot:scaffold301_cov370-Pavlova_lutheri.AAC.6
MRTWAWIVLVSTLDVWDVRWTRHDGVRGGSSCPPRVPHAPPRGVAPKCQLADPDWSGIDPGVGGSTSWGVASRTCVLSDPEIARWSDGGWNHTRVVLEDWERDE